MVKSKKGISILLVVVVGAVVLAAAISLSGLLIIQLRTSILSGNSVTAFYAAETGVECELYNYRKLSGTAGYCSTFTASLSETSTSSPAWATTSALNVTPGGATLKAVGFFGRTSRAIEVTY